MTLIADGVTIPTTGNYVRDDSSGVDFEIVQADGSIVWHLAPGVPSYISYPAQVVKDALLTVSWGGAARAVKYNLHGSFPGHPWMDLRTLSTRSTTFRLNTLGVYYFAVRAINSGGSSPVFRHGGALTVVPGIVITVPRLTIAAYRTVQHKGSTWADARFNPDGTVHGTRQHNHTPDVQYWKTGGGNAAHYEIKAEPLDGFVDGGSSLVNTWLNLSVSHHWRVQTAFKKECTLLVIIRSFGVVLGRSFIILKAEVIVRGV